MMKLKVWALLGMIVCNVGMWSLAGYALHRGWVVEALVTGGVALYQTWGTWRRWNR